MSDILSGGHPDAEMLGALLDGALEPDYSLAVAEHLAGCGLCAGRLAELAMPAVCQPPRGFREAVMLRVRGAGAAKKRRELYIYCAQVAACVAVMVGMSAAWLLRPPAPAVIETAPPSEITVTVPEKFTAPPPDERNLFERMGGYLQQLTQTIFNTEENSNDQTEK